MTFKQFINEVELPKLKFIKSNLNSQKNNVLITVDIDKINNLWKKDEGYYISPEQNGIGERRNKFQEFLKTGKDIEAPSVNLTQRGSISFTDGRHRFAVLRDMGYKQIMLSIPKNQVKLFEQL